MIPIFREIREQMYEMWYFQEIESSIITPKYFMWYILLACMYDGLLLLRRFWLPSVTSSFCVTQWALYISGVRSSGHRVKPNMAAMEALSYVGFSPTTRDFYYSFEYDTYLISHQTIFRELETIATTLSRQHNVAQSIDGKNNESRTRNVDKPQG